MRTTNVVLIAIFLFLSCMTVAGAIPGNPHSVYGQINDTDGNGINAANVQFIYNGEVLDSDLTDANGDYRVYLTDVDEGETVSMFVDGEDTGESIIFDNYGDTELNYILEVTEEPMPHTVSGYITDADGDGLDAAEVQFRDGGDTIINVSSTNATGYYNVSISGVVEGSTLDMYVDVSAEDATNTGNTITFTPGKFEELDYQFEEKDDDPFTPSGGSSTSSSSGGGGGGGSTGEAFENIASKDAQTQTVTAGANANYEFDGEGNDVTFVQFRGATNSGQIKVLIELLKDTSALVDEDAPGNVYQNVNIWVGNAAFDDDNMEDPVIGFRVSMDWMSDNGVDPASIALFHYENGWEQLETTQTDEDSDYFYFEADTTGFSPFAISTVESSAIQTQDTGGDTQTDSTGESTDTQQEDSIGSDNNSTDVPALSTIGIIGLVALVGIGAAYSMKKKNS
ncbi:PGF-pre-PGF domain-containing protein [Methanohalophilus halophilus]|uniref:PGF-pre-PGF domain-containing protein n=1 Tax=Methanohalophilus halophilus TaxID=2177 RepID=A0A1L3Q1U3_9EURY|nr:PGF-pre-PGF domain-containing protein [Methanohalophilus halophilus]APH38820.1 hypothetical protein BHR79_04505 [Methanohalophilus halophilus]RNI08015.1 PGF-pre-PGF domain-containing protein [Methanohalophilus halophilus]SDW71101.1 PGF-pre-PGF domain-containing protein [Methanohalophilus halophilus]